MRKVLILTGSLLSALLAATLVSWVHSRHMPECVASTWDVRSVPPGPVGAYFGTQSFGFYSFQGRVGFLSHAEGVTGYYAPDVIDPKNAPPVVPTHLAWEQSEAPDNVSPAYIDCFPQWSHLGISAYDGDDAGMSHETHIAAYLVNDWEITALLTLALLPIIWKLRQPQTRRAKGHCQQCNYDLRAIKTAPSHPAAPNAATPSPPFPPPQAPDRHFVVCYSRIIARNPPPPRTNPWI